MGFFRKRKVQDDPHGVEAGDARYGPPQFQIVYERKNQPDPGALAYAFESLALPPYPPSGPSITVREQWRSTNPQLYYLQSAPLAGMGTVAGQLYGQALFDPNMPGFSGAAPAVQSRLAWLNRATVNPDFQAWLRPNVVDPTRNRPGM